MALVDTHVHVWDTTRLHYPWLEANPELPRVASPVDIDTSASIVAGLTSAARHGLLLDATVRADQLDELVCVSQAVLENAEAYREWAVTADAALGLTADERAEVRRGTAIRTYGLKENHT